MDFYMPTRLFTGADCVANNAAELPKLGESCLIVTSGGAARASGALTDVTAALDAQGIRWQLWDGVTANPPVSGCAEAGRAAAKAGLAFVLGIGGGSPLDAAKAVAVFAANPELDEAAFYAKAWNQPPLPIALVGTTAGTGSEVTKVSVLTDSRGRKHSIHDDRLYARVSFGDSRYTQTCSRDVALSCGIDILAHAIEGYFSHKADDIARVCAVKAVRLAFGPLVALACEESLKKEQYGQLYEASIFAGLTINTTGTCFPHNIGYYLTENYGVPHGFACAIFLPELFELASDYDQGYSDSFFEACDVREVAITRLVRDVVPKYGIHMTEEEIDAALPRWENNGSVKNTRAEVDTSTVRAMLLRMFE